MFQSESGLNHPLLLLLGVQAYLRLMPSSTDHIILATKDQGTKRWIINGSTLQFLWTNLRFDIRSLLDLHAGHHWMHPSFIPLSVCAMFKHSRSLGSLCKDRCIYSPFNLSAVSSVIPEK